MNKRQAKKNQFKQEDLKIKEYRRIQNGPAKNKHIVTSRWRAIERVKSPMVKLLEALFGVRS